MAAATFKKRQKEVARREKQQKKLARRLERKQDKAKAPSGAPGESVQVGESASKQGPIIL